MSSQITESYDEIVSALDNTVKRQVPYSEEIWSGVKFYTNVENAKDLLWVGHIVFSHASIKPSLAAAQTLACLCTTLPQEATFPIDKLKDKITKTPPEPYPTWDSSVIKNLFNQPDGTESSSSSLLTPEKKVLLNNVLAAYGVVAAPRYKFISITLGQVYHTSFAFLYMLPRFYRKARRQNANIDMLVIKVAKINPLVEPSFLSVLFETFCKQGKWEVYMNEGGPIKTNVAIGGLLLLHATELPRTLKNELEFSMLGVIFYAFTAYELLSKVARLDKRPDGKVLQRIPTASSDEMLGTIVGKIGFLEEKPCWYSIAPICNPDVLADFSSSKQPVISKTLTLIIKWLDKTQEYNISKLVIKLSPKEREEANFGYECYRKFFSCEKIQATIRVSIDGREIWLEPWNMGEPSTSQKKKTDRQRGRRKDSSSSSDSELEPTSTHLSAYL